MAMGTTATKRAASRALAELTIDGTYPPEWVTEIGNATPDQAWRRYDVFGDDEAIAATFSYGETEHAIVVQVDLTGVPIATAVGVAANAASLLEAMSRDDDAFDRPEQISLAEALRVKPIDVLLADHHYFGGFAGCLALGPVCDAAGWTMSQPSNNHAGLTMAAMIHLAAPIPPVSYTHPTPPANDP